MHKKLDRCSWWGQIVVPAGAGLYAVCQYEGGDVLLLARALIVNQAFIEVLKKTISMRRPNGHSGSFPSGHTAAVFVAPVYIALKYGWKDAKIPTLLSLIAAVLVAASRVILKAHFVADVVGGIVLGCSVMILSMKLSEIDEKLLTLSAVISGVVLVVIFKEKAGKAVSRILSRAIIPLGVLSPKLSSVFKAT